MNYLYIYVFLSPQRKRIMRFLPMSSSMGFLLTGGKCTICTRYTIGCIVRITYCMLFLAYSFLGTTTVRPHPNGLPPRKETSTGALSVIILTLVAPRHPATLLFRSNYTRPSVVYVSRCNHKAMVHDRAEIQP